MRRTRGAGFSFKYDMDKKAVRELNACDQAIEKADGLTQKPICRFHIPNSQSWGTCVEESGGQMEDDGVVET
jgi:hypothetical protein